MINDNVYYIHVKEYKYAIPAHEMMDRFLNSSLSSDIKDKEDFKKFSLFNLKYNIVEKDNKEQEIDVIIGKKMLQHIKEFFDKDEPKIELKGYNKNQKSFKKTNKTNNNKTLKKK